MGAGSHRRSGIPSQVWLALVPDPPGRQPLAPFTSRVTCPAGALSCLSQPTAPAPKPALAALPAASRSPWPPLSVCATGLLSDFTKITGWLTLRVWGGKTWRSLSALPPPCVYSWDLGFSICVMEMTTMAPLAGPLQRWEHGTATPRQARRLGLSLASRVQCTDCGEQDDGDARMTVTQGNLAPALAPPLVPEPGAPIRSCLQNVGGGGWGA